MNFCRNSIFSVLGHGLIHVNRTSGFRPRPKYTPSIHPWPSTVKIFFLLLFNTWKYWFLIQKSCMCILSNLFVPGINFCVLYIKYKLALSLNLFSQFFNKKLIEFVLGSTLIQNWHFVDPSVHYCTVLVVNLL